MRRWLGRAGAAHRSSSVRLQTLNPKLVFCFVVGGCAHVYRRVHPHSKHGGTNAQVRHLPDPKPYSLSSAAISMPIKYASVASEPTTAVATLTVCAASARASAARIAEFAAVSAAAAESATAW
jgi:uncharacterized protein YceK